MMHLYILQLQLDI